MDLSELERLEQDTQENEVVRTLRRAKARIDTPKKWARIGQWCHPNKECVGVALLQAAGNGVLSADCAALQLFGRMLGMTDPGSDIPAWNDAPGRTHAEVMRAFDDAISLAARGL